MSVAYRIAPDPLDPLVHALGGFPIADDTLLAKRALLRRIDTKFVVPSTALSIVDELTRDYALLAKPAALAMYRSLYFDTPELRCFHDHRRGRRIRSKVRIRHYPDRRLGFLEIKTRRNDFVTDKLRIDIGYGQVHLGERERRFLRQYLPYADELRPQLWVDYRRIMLLGLHTDERVSIDVELEARTLDDTRMPLGSIAVVEVKQATAQRTRVLEALASAGLREGSASKYVAATAQLHPDIRMNRLLPALRALEAV